MKDEKNLAALIASSVSDTKPVHFLSTGARLLKWVSKKKKLYDKLANKDRIIEFLQMELQNDYNYSMNDVDILD